MKKWAVVAMGLSLFFVGGAWGNSAWAKDIQATTNDGKAVTLMDDGTWIFTETGPGGSPSSGQYEKPASATRLVRGKRGNFGIWLNSSKWRMQKKKNNADAMFEFQHINGDAYVMVIAERISMPLDVLKKVAINNVKSVGRNVRVVSEEKRIVNGNEVLMLKIQAVIQSIPFVYYNYYYAGKAGSIQGITYTGTNLFDEYKNDFDDLLNGLVILK